MDWHAIEEKKFLRVTRHVLSPSKQGAIIDGVLGLAGGELDPLLRHLRFQARTGIEPMLTTILVGR